MIEKYKNEIILITFFLVFIVTFFFLYGIILPFIFALLLAFGVDPIIKKVQKIFKPRLLATSVFIGGILAILALFIIVLTKYINRDFQRLNHSFTLLISKNQSNLDKTGQKVKEFVGGLYDFEEIEKNFKIDSDSIISSVKNLDASNLDLESIKSGFDKILSVFKSSNEEPNVKKKGFGIYYIFSSTIMYFLLIIYNFQYFKNLKIKYLSPKTESALAKFLDDFDKSFTRYFKLRTKVVLLLAIPYLIGFVILDLPGTFIIIALIILLSYISFLQYLTLIPICLGCLVLSMESSHDFIFFFLIILGIFIVVSLIDELVLTPIIMEKNIGMNPAIMVFAISFWSYVLGTLGFLIGIPLTSLFIIYFKRFILPSYLDKTRNRELPSNL